LQEHGVRAVYSDNILQLCPYFALSGNLYSCILRRCYVRVVIASPPRSTDLHGKMMMPLQIPNNKPNSRSERLPHKMYRIARP